MECVQLHEALVVGRAAESLPHISPCHAIASINSEREGTSVTFQMYSFAQDTIGACKNDRPDLYVI
jgi:hypothetical protein